MRIAIASDHAGFALKRELVGFLSEGGHEVEDLGTSSDEPVDYPAFCASAARAVASGRAERAIVLGGSGQGEQIAANKVRGIRAALCNDVHLARLSRQHNDANVLSMGGRIVALPLAMEIVGVWLSTPFEGGRHEARVQQIGMIERGELEP
jgi:ribose 5-phosphate isomerase B